MLVIVQHIHQLVNRISTSAHLRTTAYSKIPVYLLNSLLFCLTLFSTTANAVFTTPGQFSVGSDGSANYSIPIQVPPGTAGMAPTLSLNYNSNGGNGILGMGWGLSGLSQIGRCPQTLAQDNKRGGVNYDTDDRFCLDGQRLIAVTGTYGADNTTYRTELDNFAKIVSYGIAGNGPAWFKVWTKSGQIIEYGNTTDSRIEAQGKPTVRSWGVNKVSDTKGNYFTVTFIEDNANGEAYVSRIDYTGNARATPALAPYASVQFSYEARTDIETGYVAGSVIKSTKRMTNVKTFNGTSLVKDYRLTYEQSTATQRSRLKSLTECDGVGGCLQAVGLGWQSNQSYSHNFVQYYNQLGWGKANGFTNGSAFPILIGDWNGDGKMDWGRVQGGETSFFVSNGSGFTQITGVAGWGTSSGFTNDSDYPILIGDWNGDGKTDWGRVQSAATTFFSNPNSSFDFISALTPNASNATTLTYRPLTDNTIYTKDSGTLAAVYPIQDIQAPAYVVSSVTSSDGVGGVVTTNYTYGGLKADVGTGRGSLGFRWMQSTSPDSSQTSTTYYRQDFPYIGLPLRVQKATTTGAILSCSGYSYSCLNTANGSACAIDSNPANNLGKYYFPYVNQSVENQYELNHNATSCDDTSVPPVTSTTTSYQYDNYGNATQITVNSNDGHVKTTTNSYNNDATNWLLGRLLRSTVTSTSP